MVVDALKKIFSRVGAGGAPGWEQWYGVEGEAQDTGATQAYIDDIISQLIMVRDHFNRMKHEIVARIEDLKAKIQHAIYVEKDRETAELLAAEYMQERYILQGVTAFEKLIDMTLKRIRVIRHINEMYSFLVPLSQAMNALSQQLVQAGPEYAAGMYAVKEMMENIIKQAGAMAKSVPRNVDISSLDPEVKNAINEALREAVEEVNYLAPKPVNVVDYEELESKMIDYIKRNNGVVRLRDAARELGVSPKVVREVLYRLAQKGLITLTKTSGRQSGREGPLPA